MLSAKELDLCSDVMTGCVSSATSDWMTANDGLEPLLRLCSALLVCTLMRVRELEEASV